MISLLVARAHRVDLVWMIGLPALGHVVVGASNRNEMAGAAAGPQAGAGVATVIVVAVRVVVALGVAGERDAEHARREDEAKEVRG